MLLPRGYNNKIAEEAATLQSMLVRKKGRRKQMWASSMGKEAAKSRRKEKERLGWIESRGSERKERVRETLNRQLVTFTMQTHVALTTSSTNQLIFP